MPSAVATRDGARRGAPSRVGPIHEACWPSTRRGGGQSRRRAYRFHQTIRWTCPCWSSRRDRIPRTSPGTARAFLERRRPPRSSSTCWIAPWLKDLRRGGPGRAVGPDWPVTGLDDPVRRQGTRDPGRQGGGVRGLRDAPLDRMSAESGAGEPGVPGAPGSPVAGREVESDVLAPDQSPGLVPAGRSADPEHFGKPTHRRVPSCCSRWRANDARRPPHRR